MKAISLISLQTGQNSNLFRVNESGADLERNLAIDEKSFKFRGDID